MRTTTTIIILGLLAAGPASAAAPADKPLLLKNGTIITVSGETIAGGDILVRNGKIAGVGKGLAAPDAEAVDLGGRWVMPGIIDSHSHIALEGDVNETGDLITSEVDVRDIINPQDMNIYYALTGGVTAIQTLHGSANPIAGRGVVLKLRWGADAAGLIFEGAPVTSKWALGENPKQSNFSMGGKPRYPKSRMGVEASIRLEFAKAREYARKWKGYEQALAARRARKAKGPSPLPPKRDLRLEGIVEILEGKLWVHCHAYQSEEMLSIMRLCKEYGVKLASFEHALEGYRIADELVRDGVGISVFADFWGYKWEAYNTMPHNAALAAKRGVCVALNSDDPERMRHLFNDAAKTVRFGGLSESEAIKMLTLNPARMLGIDKRVGTIETGKDADLAVFDRNPLDPYTVCQMTIVDGKVLFDRDRYLEDRKKAEEAAKAKEAEAKTPKGKTPGGEV